MKSRNGEASNGLLGGLKLPVGMKRIMDCLEKLCKWHESPSILLMSYSCFSSFTSPRKSDNDLTRKIAGLLCRRPGILILDEGHKPRCIESLLRKTLMNVTINLRILLSGTLFQNNFEEYFNSLCLARPAFIQEVLNEFQPAISVSKSVRRPSARERRIMAKEKLARSIFIKEIASRINSEEEEDRKNGLKKLHRMTDGFIDVYEGRLLDSLPGLQTYTILLKPTLLQQKILSKLETLKNKLSLEIEPMITNAAIHVWLVKTISNSGKFFCRRDLDIDKYKIDINHGSKIRFIVDLLKALIFCRYIPPIYLLVEIFSKIFRWEIGKEALVLQGNQDTVERSTIMDKFSDREGCCHVLIASTTTCSEGINLTAASRLVLLDSEWNPSKTKQAIARAFRLGQEKIVYVYRLLAAGTLEEEKHERAAIENDISGSSYKQTKHIEDDMLRELVERDHAKMFHSIMKHDKLVENTALVYTIFYLRYQRENLEVAHSISGIKETTITKTVMTTFILDLTKIKQPRAARTVAGKEKIVGGMRDREGVSREEKPEKERGRCYLSRTFQVAVGDPDCLLDELDNERVDSIHGLMLQDSNPIYRVVHALGDPSQC
ncbi:SNF2 domain-containing protein CLASSY 1 [Nymphaea thermarum]|nr:SNF2 domain-containing protein CLASSY 1 [Nymphaea thermarum]